MNNQPEFEMDLYADWVNELKDLLVKSGYTDIPSDEKIPTTYFRIIQRQISLNPRKVLLSSEFCCPIEYSTGFRLFKDEVKLGKNLNPRLSRQMKKASFNDGMLIDWGIHHFHLGERASQSAGGMVEGTKHVLFAKITDDTVYILGVYEHGEWSNQDVIETLNSNWPSLLGGYQLNAKSVYPNITGKERDKLRKAGVVLLTETSDGKILFPLGGGAASDGTSIDAVAHSDDYSRNIVFIEKDVKKHLASEFDRLGYSLFHNQKFGLHLKIDKHEITLVDDKEIEFWRSGVLVPEIISVIV